MNTDEHGHGGADMSSMKYSTFAQMIGVGTLVMFGLMYLNVYSSDHVYFSETRAYMAILMMAFMWKMYPRKGLNSAIVGGSVIVFGLTLWLVRSQATVDEVSYMRAMIPHHSIAILTSERAAISDPKVRELADKIIAAQRKEIGEMKAYIQELEARH